MRIYLNLITEKRDETICFFCMIKNELYVVVICLMMKLFSFIKIISYVVYKMVDNQLT
jgi:hypothetical protein